MKGKNVEPRRLKAPKGSYVRASISFPADIYESLVNLASQRKVSLAWVVRDATEKYVANQTMVPGDKRA
jgi:hypothetical protein